MRSIKFNPFAPVAVKSFERVFDEIFKSDIGAPAFPGQRPLVNVAEHPTEFKLEVAAPGLTKEDFKISVEKDQLTLSTNKESKSEDTKENYSRREFNFTSFKRSFYLPETVNTEAIAANYESGILTLTLPKKEEAKEKGPRIVAVA